MIAWLLRRWRDRHDDAAVMQRRPTPVGGFHPEKGTALYERSRRQSETGRRLPSPKVGSVEPFRRAK